MTSAQRASVNALRWIAEASKKAVVISQPEPMHLGDNASLIATVTVQDITSAAHPLPKVKQRFLIEAGGCVARIYE